MVWWVLYIVDSTPEVHTYEKETVRSLKQSWAVFRFFPIVTWTWTWTWMRLNRVTLRTSHPPITAYEKCYNLRRWTTYHITSHHKTVLWWRNTTVQGAVITETNRQTDSRTETLQPFPLPPSLSLLSNIIVVYCAVTKSMISISVSHFGKGSIGFLRSESNR